MDSRRPTHPGELLYEDVLKPLHLSITQAARDLSISRKTLSEIVHAKCSVTPEMAIRIALATNTTPESWLAMQSKYDLWIIKNTKNFTITKFTQPQSA